MSDSAFPDSFVSNFSSEERIAFLLKAPLDPSLSFGSVSCDLYAGHLGSQCCTV